MGANPFPRRSGSISLTRRTVLGALAGSIAAPRVAAGDGAFDALRGLQTTLLIGSDIGGANDAFARLFGRHLQAAVPQLDLFMKNIGQAGGKLCGKILQESAGDGSVIALVPAGVLSAQILGEEGVAYDLGTWNWIGKLGSETRFLVKGPAADFATILDLRADRAPASLSVRSASSFAYYEALWINAILGLRMKPIPGYKSGEKEVAVIAGEVMMTTANYPDDDVLLSAAGVEPILRVSAKGGRDPYERVPELTDLRQDRGRYDLVTRFLQANYELSRWIIAPPGMPAPLVAAFRAAFDAVVASPAFEQDGRRLKLELTPMPGHELATRMTSILSEQDALRQSLQAAFACGKSLSEGLGSACRKS
jgi:tripartite-type tricarboxylate transporter receptor subunit TctC